MNQRWQITLFIVLVLAAILLSRCGPPVKIITSEPQPTVTLTAAPTQTAAPTAATQATGAPTCSPKRP